MRVDPEEHRVVVVLSPKGGVGKTTISTNLAIALSRRTPLDTVIVDFDSQFGDVASVLNINALHTLEDAFTEDSVHPPLVVKGLLNAFDDRLLVLAASESPAALEKITPVQESELLRQLSKDYAFVVVDTGSGLTDETMAALEVATDVIMVTTMDVSSVKALRRAADLLDRIDLLPRSRHLVVNMTESGTGLEVEDIAHAMQMPVDVSIARSVDIALSVNTGRPLAQAKRSADLTSAVDNIVAKLRGETSRRKGGLFRRDE
nr:P-loop NTPase [Aeromicrobium senzhongii]